MDSTQRGACDRCRGQKLRCVGLSGLMPTFESEGRLQRNEKPCDRCRKAQVECYSVRPASRRKSSISSNRLEEKSGHGAQRPGRKTARKLLRHTLYNTSPENHTATTTDIGDDLLVDHEHSNSPLQSTSGWPSPEPFEFDWDSLDKWAPSHIDHHEKEFSSQSPAITTRGFSPQDTSKSAQEPNDYFGIRIESDLGMGNIGSLGSNHAPSETQQIHTSPASNDTYSIHSTSLEARQVCVQELTELNEALLQDKKTTNSRKQPQAKSPTSHPASLSNRLRSAKVSSADSQRSSFLKSHDDPKSFSRLMRESNFDGARTSTRSSRSPGPFLSTPSPTLSFSTTSSDPRLAPLDMPTILSIICCYAYIVEAYSSIFSEILQCIVHSPEDLQAIWTGLSLDGFSLDGHLTMQLECLLHVAGCMLDKMERILVGSSDLALQHRSEGLLENKLSAGLLDALYCQDDSATSGDTGRKELRIKRDMRRIQAALKFLD
ncbi:hypothetical protein ACMFMG_006037 [Clarireedia jacksonii]